MTEPVIIEWHGMKIVKISSVGDRFQKWLYGQTLPYVNEEKDPLDWAYISDYNRFISGLPIID